MQCKALLLSPHTNKLLATCPSVPHKTHTEHLCPFLQVPLHIAVSAKAVPDKTTAGFGAQAAAEDACTSAPTGSGTPSAAMEALFPPRLAPFLQCHGVLCCLLLLGWAVLWCDVLCCAVLRCAAFFGCTKHHATMLPMLLLCG